jgi:hypothetical protein
VSPPAPPALLALLERFAGRADSTIEVSRSDHSLWLSRPDAVTRIVLDIAVSG